MCGYITGKRCENCGQFKVAWFCGEEGGVGAIECRGCGHPYDIEKTTLELSVKRIEAEKDPTPTS